MRTALKWTVGLVLVLVVALYVFLVYSLDTVRGPLARAVSAATGRELVIDGRIHAVWSWTHPRFRVERVTLANADWAKDDYLFSAEAVEAEFRLLPLLRGRF